LGEKIENGKEEKLLKRNVSICFLLFFALIQISKTNP